VTTYDDLAQAAAAVADPETGPQDLMAIAQQYPTLWIDIAKHQNAYPGLLDWLQQFGDDTVRATVAARTSPVEVEEPAEAVFIPPEEDKPAPEAVLIDHVPGFQDPFLVTSHDPTSPTSIINARHKHRRKLTKTQVGFGIAAVVVLLAAALVLVFVIHPWTSGQDHSTAVTEFTDASTACTDANKTLASSITRAQRAAKTDPTNIDSSLIDGLNQAITTAKSVTACVPPAMAEKTSEIRQQASQLADATQTVTDAASTIDQATQAVTDAVQAYEASKAQQNGVTLPLGALVPGGAEVTVWTLFGSLVIGWGGLARTWATADSSSYVAMWYPAMARPSVCPLSLGEQDTDIVNVTFGATAGTQPVGLLQYIQRKTGQGTDAQTEYQAFSVEIDPRDCSLDTPVEYGSSWTDQSGDPTVLGSYVTSDGDIVAFGYGDLNSKWNLYAIDATTSALAWHSGPHQRCNMTDPPNADCTWGTSGMISYGSDFIATKTGKVVPLGFTASGVYALGDGIYLANDWDHQRWASVTMEGATIDQEATTSDQRAFQLSDGQAVLFGDKDDPAGYRYFAPDGSHHQLFTRDQVTSSRIILGEVTQGNVYIQQNGQFVVTDLTGKQIGTWDGDMSTLPTWDIPTWPGWTMWDLDANANAEQARYNYPLPM